MASAGVTAVTGRALRTTSASAASAPGAGRSATLMTAMMTACPLHQTLHRQLHRLRALRAPLLVGHRYCIDMHRIHLVAW